MNVPRTDRTVYTGVTASARFRERRGTRISRVRKKSGEPAIHLTSLIRAAKMVVNVDKCFDYS